MMNLFKADDNDLAFLFDSAGIDVLINDEQRKAIVTNKSHDIHDTRFLHTLEPINLGDEVKINDNYFLVVTQNLEKRHAKYKIEMKACNYSITVVTAYKIIEKKDSFGRPIFIKEPSEWKDLPAIVDSKSYSVDFNAQIPLSDEQIAMTMQNNEFTIEAFTLNSEHTVNGKKYKVIEVDKHQKNLLIVVLVKVAS